MSTSVTLTGRLGRDPELRFTSSGKAQAHFSMATSRLRKTDDGWEETEVTWWNVTCWGTLAENVAESLTKGTEVIVQGKVKARSWEDKEGNTQTRMEVDAYHVGPDLRRVSASVNKTERSTHNTKRDSDDDPWAKPDPWAGSDVPPF